MKCNVCILGLKDTYKYCDKFQLPYKKCGKLVVATNEIEVQRLDALYSRALGTIHKRRHLICTYSFFMRS